MSSFTSDPVLKVLSLYEWQLYVAFTYYRDPILKADGSVKKPEEYTEEEKKYRSWDKMVVPAGFVSNLTSTPRFLWSILPPHDYYVKAAILHDYLYNQGIGTRKEADLVFYEALGVLGMPKLLRKGFYYAVRLFGRSTSQHVDKR